MAAEEAVTSSPEADLASAPGSGVEPPARLRLLTWLRTHAPPLAELYEGALRILSDAAFPGRVRFVAHAMREISNRLLDYLVGRQETRRIPYERRLDAILVAWRSAGIPIDTVGLSTAQPEHAEQQPGVTVPRPVFDAVHALLQEHASAPRDTHRDLAFRLFEAIGSMDPALRDQITPVVNQWLDLARWSVARCHDEGVPHGRDYSEELNERFAVFETMLAALVGGFFHTIEGLDEILEDANS